MYVVLEFIIMSGYFKVLDLDNDFFNMSFVIKQFLNFISGFLKF